MTETAETVTQREHREGVHRDYRPRSCAECWPNGAPAATTPTPRPAPEPTPAPPRPRQRGEGWEGLGAGLRRIYTPRGDGTLAPDPDTEGPLGGPLCDVCHGARFVRFDVDREHPDFGRAIPCTAPECAAYAERRQLERFEREIPYDVRAASIEGGTPGPHPDQRAAFDRVGAWLSWPGFWLYVYGPPGRGKTWLVVAGARAKRRTASFVKVTDLLREIAATYDRDNRARDEMRELDVIDRYTRVPVLVLDELGVESPTAWAEERIYQVLDARASDREAVTLITSNLSPKRLEARLGRGDREHGERLVSRIVGRCGPFVLPISEDAPDLRVRNAIREVF